MTEITTASSPENTSVPVASNTPVRFPFFGMLLGPYTLFMDHTRTFCVCALPFALLMSIISLVGAQGLLCLFGDFRESGGWCTNNVPWFTAIHLLNFFVLCMFMVRWYNLSFGTDKFSWRYLFTPRKADFRLCVTLIVFILLNLISALSFYLLYIRVPNPDWRLEVIYFGFVSIGFLVPFILIRFYSVFAFVMEGEPLPPLSCIWKRSRSNTLKILLSLSLIFFFAVFSFFAFINEFKLVEVKNAFYISFMAEYLYNLLFLLMTVFFADHCYLQKYFMFGRISDDREL